MGKSKPRAPDPKVTAGAQTATNIGSAIANNAMSMVDEYTPYGNKIYGKSGTEEWRDPNTGQVHQIPRYNVTQTLTPDGQAIQSAQMGAGRNMANLAQEQSGRLSGLLSRPFEISNESTEARLMELGMARHAPRLAERRDQMATQLANQGIGLGSTAHDRAMRGVTESENDLFNQLLLQGRGQAVQEQLLERRQPIDEINAVRSGEQMRMPNFVNPNTAQIGTPDIMGLTQLKFQQDSNAYNQTEGMWGGLFGNIAKGIALGSDRRIKRDIEPLGLLGPFTVYAYRYAWEDADAPLSAGVMAQEVAEIMPAAVTDVYGTLHVDYGRLAEAL